MKTLVFKGFEGLEAARIAPEWHPGHAGCSTWLSGVMFRAGATISIDFHGFGGLGRLAGGPSSNVRFGPLPPRPCPTKKESSLEAGVQEPTRQEPA